MSWPWSHFISNWMLKFMSSSCSVCKLKVRTVSLWGHFAARCTTEPPQKMWSFCFGSQIALQLVSLFYFSLIWQIWTFVLLVSSYFMDLWVLGTKGCNVLPSTVEICFKSLAVSASWCGCQKAVMHLQVFSSCRDRWAVCCWFTKSALSIIELQVAPPCR